MTKNQLNIFKNFSEQEIISTGADLIDIDFKSFEKLQKFRLLINNPILFQKNGITSGYHYSKEHGGGKAFDIRFKNIVTDFSSVYSYFKKALKVGFTGIGIYWNGSEFSFHLDDGERIRFWNANKNLNNNNWFYSGLINDVRI